MALEGAEMLKHYSHIRTQTKRLAVNSLVKPKVTERAESSPNSQGIPQEVLRSDRNNRS
jgi:hypothetical protein